MSKRPPGLVAVIAYKAVTAVSLAVVSVSLLLALEHQPELEKFSESLTLAGKRGVIVWVLDKLLNFNSKTLQLSGIAAAAYAAMTTVEAAGLWYQKAWARWWVLGVVGISFPPEIFELIRGFSLLKIIVFLLNIAIFVYLLWNPKKTRR